MPAERYQRYHEAKARGGIALTMFGGSSNVSPDSQWNFPQINLHDERIVEHLRRFSERIHAHGAHLMCQITHVGGRGEPYAGARLAPIGPSPVRETLHRAFAREMDEHDVERVVADYARAAVRCRDGGLDGIETLTGAHLIGQFLSPVTNRRTDRFGGSVENRCRFGLMVHEAIRKAVGDDFIVGIRFVIDEAGEHRLDFRGMPGDRPGLPGVRHHRLLQRHLRSHGHPDQARGGLHAGHGVAHGPVSRPGRCVQAGGGSAGLPRHTHLRCTPSRGRRPRGSPRFPFHYNGLVNSRVSVLPAPPLELRPRPGHSLPCPEAVANPPAPASATLARRRAAPHRPAARSR